jgi:hypothetical protein
MQQAFLKGASESCSGQAQLTSHVFRFLNGQKLAKIQFSYKAPPKRQRIYAPLAVKLLNT